MFKLRLNAEAFYLKKVLTKNFARGVKSAGLLIILFRHSAIIRGRLDIKNYM